MSLLYRCNEHPTTAVGSEVCRAEHARHIDARSTKLLVCVALVAFMIGAQTCASVVDSHEAQRMGFLEGRLRACTDGGR